MNLTLHARTARSTTDSEFDLDDDRALSLHDAAAENNIRILKMFLQFPDVDLDGLDAGGITPLVRAVMNGSLKAAKLLLVAGANPNFDSIGGGYALHAAVWTPSVDMVRLLLDHGADTEVRSSRGTTPLIECAAFGTPEIAQVLLEHGADVLAIDPLGCTALHWADSVEMAEVLIEGNVHVNAIDNDGDTALDLAEENGNADLAEFLERRGGIRGRV